MRKSFYLALLCIGLFVTSCTNVEEKATGYADKCITAQLDGNNKDFEAVSEEFETWVEDLKTEDRALAKNTFEDQYGLIVCQKFPEEMAQAIAAVKEGKSSAFSTQVGNIVKATKDLKFPECMKSYFDKDKDALSKYASKAVKKGIALYLSEQMAADIEAPAKALCESVKASDKDAIKEAAKELSKIKSGLSSDYENALDPAIEKCIAANLIDEFKKYSDPVCAAFDNLDKADMKTACKEYDKFIGLIPKDFQEPAKNAFSETLFEGFKAVLEAHAKKNISASESDLKTYAKDLMKVSEAMTEDVLTTFKKASEEQTRKAEEALKEIEKASAEMQQ